jgi:hypothetical protein
MYNIFQRRIKSILANTDALGSVLLAQLMATDTRPAGSALGEGK